MTPENLTKMCEEALERHDENCAGWYGVSGYCHPEWILARALKGLLPYVEHGENCNTRWRFYNEERPCDCGLSSLLASLDSQG